MAKKKELSQVKARQTKLGKKSNEELIQIILKKDKVERNLNKQIKSLKGEVNELSTRVNNFDKDMEGNKKYIATLEDRVNTLLEKNDNLFTQVKGNEELYKLENKKSTLLADNINTWKNITCLMTAIAIAAVVIAIL